MHYMPEIAGMYGLPTYRKDVSVFSRAIAAEDIDSTIENADDAHLSLFPNGEILVFPKKKAGSYLFSSIHHIDH